MSCWFGDEYNDINEGNTFVKLCFECFYVYLHLKHEITGVHNVKIKKPHIILCYKNSQLIAITYSS